MYTIIVQQIDEPFTKSLVAHGLYQSREEAFEALPDLVRDYIAPDPADEDEVATPDEIDREVERIARTGEGEAFGVNFAIGELNNPFSPEESQALYEALTDTIEENEECLRDETIAACPNEEPSASVKTMAKYVEELDAVRKTFFPPDPAEGIIAPLK